MKNIRQTYNFLLETINNQVTNTDSSKMKNDSWENSFPIFTSDEIRNMLKIGSTDSGQFYSLLRLLRIAKNISQYEISKEMDKAKFDGDSFINWYIPKGNIYFDEPFWRDCDYSSINANLRNLWLDDNDELQVEISVKFAVIGIPNLEGMIAIDIEYDKCPEKIRKNISKFLIEEGLT